MTSRIIKRTGPRPLPLHLWIAATVLMSSRSAFESLNALSPNWQPPSGNAPGNDHVDPLAAFGAQIADMLQHHAEIGAAIEAAARDRLDAFLSGVERYRSHSYRRSLPEKPTVWSAGTTRLLDYGDDAASSVDVVFVPSLINRGLILDLSPERSLLRWLAGHEGPDGRRIRPYLLDWDAPGDEERGFDLHAYITRRIEPAVAHVARLSGRRPVIAGYCMGGLLALAAAVRRPDLTGGLALLATPWDFHADRGEQARLIGQIWPHVEQFYQTVGEVPVDVLQCLFFALDPLLALKKFTGFAAIDATSAKASAFVALEDWINDGVPLAAPVASECFTRWYGENRPGLGSWAVGDTTIRPEDVDAPSLVACPTQDRIVPPESSRPLAGRIGRALVLEPAVGHVGMVVGGRAKQALWEPLAGWLHDRS